MKAMKRIGMIIVLLVAFATISKAQNNESRNIGLIEKESNIIDTIFRTDTIIIKEVITRTDVVHRTEKVVRYEEKSLGSSSRSDSKPASIESLEENIVLINQIESVEDISNTVSRAIGNTTSEASILEIRDENYLNKEGGKYIWIPDSLEENINNILSGVELYEWKNSNKDDAEFNPNERVIFRGDTIPMVLHDRNLGRFNRGLFNFLFIPKGIWQIGLTASYGEFSTEDLEILDLVSDIDFSGHLFSIRPYFSYFIKNNISVGMRLGYTSGKANIGSFKMEIDEDMSFNLHDIMYKSESYTAALTLSQYLGIARRGRFGVFNEVELAFSSGSSDFHRPFNGEMKKTHTTTMEAALNFSPGLCVYMLDQVSFNVSFGVFGLNIRHANQKENDVFVGSRTTSGANFRFNIFNINFGIAVNI